MFLHICAALSTRYANNIELSEKYKVITPVGDLHLHLTGEKLGDNVNLYMSTKGNGYSADDHSNNQINNHVSDRDYDRVYFKKLYNHTGYQMFVNNNQICYDVYKDLITCDKKTSHIWDVEEYKNGVTICTTVPNKDVNDKEESTNDLYLHNYYNGMHFTHITPNTPNNIANDQISYNYEYCLTMLERQNYNGNFGVNIQYARKYYVNQIFNIYEVNDMQMIGECVAINRRSNLVHFINHY